MSEKRNINVEVKIMEVRDDGGRIVINTAAFDRDRDRVIPAGAKIENYMNNPVVQWGHNYSDPAATIGRTNAVDIFEDRIEVDFDLRPAANENDPQNIVRLLWSGNWVRTASVGFIPLESDQNDRGGFDFNSWELLEWSLVPIPANQEALRLAVKSFIPLPENVSISINNDNLDLLKLEIDGKAIKPQESFEFEIRPRKIFSHTEPTQELKDDLLFAPLEIMRRQTEKDTSDAILDADTEDPAAEDEAPPTDETPNDARAEAEAEKVNELTNLLKNIEEQYHD